jgi:hypothetical protein
VQVLQGAGDVHADAEERLDGHALAGGPHAVHQGPQAQPVDPLPNEEEAVGVAPQVQGLQQVRVRQAHAQAGLVRQAQRDRQGLLEGGVGHLEHDALAEAERAAAHGEEGGDALVRGQLALDLEVLEAGHGRLDVDVEQVRVAPEDARIRGRAVAHRGTTRLLIQTG